MNLVRVTETVHQSCDCRVRLRFGLGQRRRWQERTGDRKLCSVAKASGAGIRQQGHRNVSGWANHRPCCGCKWMCQVNSREQSLPNHTQHRQQDVGVTKQTCFSLVPSCSGNLHLCGGFWGLPCDIALAATVTSCLCIMEDMGSALKRWILITSYLVIPDPINNSYVHIETPFVEPTQNLGIRSPLHNPYLSVQSV